MLLTISILTLFLICFLLVLKNRIETYVPEIVFLEEDEKENENQDENNNYDFSSYYVNKKRKNVYHDNRNKIRKPKGLFN